MKSSIRTIIFIWLAWGLIIIGFQTVVEARLTVHKPDLALFWTSNETRPSSQNDQAYLKDLFMNEQVSWDSEFYLSMATAGMTIFSLEHIARSMPQYISPQQLRQINEDLARV